MKTWVLKARHGGVCQEHQHWEGKVRQILGACQAASVAKSVSYRSSERPSQKTRWRVISKDIWCWFLPPQHMMCMHKNIHLTHMHTRILLILDITLSLWYASTLFHTSNCKGGYRPWCSLPSPGNHGSTLLLFSAFFSWKILHYVRSSGKCKSKPPELSPHTC